MTATALLDIIERLLRTEPKPDYPKKAFLFVAECVTLGIQQRNTNNENKHITADDIIATCAKRAVENFGVMASAVLRSWKINVADDIGVLVFLLIDGGVFRAGEDDSLAQFVHGLNLNECIEKCLKEQSLPPSENENTAPLPFLD